jgi:hypothetical protein
MSDKLKGYPMPAERGCCDVDERQASDNAGLEETADRKRRKICGRPGYGDLSAARGGKEAFDFEIWQVVYRIFEIASAAQAMRKL